VFLILIIAVIDYWFLASSMPLDVPIHMNQITQLTHSGNWEDSGFCTSGWNLFINLLLVIDYLLLY